MIVLSHVTPQILIGGKAHPYLEPHIAYQCFDSSDEGKSHANRYRSLAGLIMEAPAVRWPKEVREGVSPALINLVEALLRRDGSRAGVEEVRETEPDWHHATPDE